MHSYWLIRKPAARGPACYSRLLKNQVGTGLRETLQAAHTARSSLLIAHAQSMKNTDTANPKGYGAGKQVSGIKRHIACRYPGAAHAIAVTTAELSNRKEALQTIKHCKPSLSRVQSLRCDSDHVGQPFAQGERETPGDHAAVQITKRNQPDGHVQGHASAGSLLRSFAWLDKNRRLLKRCERLWLNTSLQPPIPSISRVPGSFASPAFRAL